MSDPLGPTNEESDLSWHARQTRDAETVSFHMPGHKGGPGAPLAGVELFGEAVYAADVSEMGGFDYLHHPDSALITSQQRAAKLFGAKQSWFLVNGATVGNIAAICSCVLEGESIVVARGSHRSVYAGLVVCGARPVYLPPIRNEQLDSLFGVDTADLESVVNCSHARAVHLTSPSYYGFTIDLETIAASVHECDSTLIVDEAHGTHFALHPAYPNSALSCGADLVVQSPHKTLGSLTQSSLLHLQGARVDAAQLDSWLQMLQSSSPSALLTVSLDVAIAEMAATGERRWDQALEFAENARREIAGIDGLRVYGDEVCQMDGIDGYDPTKLVVDVSDLGITGFEAADWLWTHHHIRPEFSDMRRMVFSLTYADTEHTAKTLVDALGQLGKNSRRQSTTRSISSLWPQAIPEMVLTPRQGIMQASIDVSIDKAVGRVAAEMVVPYPPGIPLLVPGERISATITEALRQLETAGAKVVGMADPQSRHIRCIES